MNRSDIKQLIREELKKVLKEFAAPAKSYSEFSQKFHNDTIRNWALYANLYEKDIIKARSERELDQREREVLPKLPRKDMKDAYRMFLLYKHDVLKGLQKEDMIKEIITSCKAYYIGQLHEAAKKSRGEIVHAIDTLIKKYENNPYGIGAERVIVKKEYVELLFSDQWQRKQGLENLVKLGIPKNLIGSHTQSSGHSFPYELTIMRESIIKEEVNWKDFDEVRISGSYGHDYGNGAGGFTSRDKSIHNMNDAINAFQKYAKTDSFLQKSHVKKVLLTVMGWTRGSAPVKLGQKLIVVKK